METLHEMRTLLESATAPTAPKVNTYEGTLQENKRDGRGTMNYANGDVYVGSWLEDKRSGRGIMNYANGNVYEGLWQADKFQGLGKFTHHSRGHKEGFDWKFFGEFKDDFPDCGTLTYNENNTCNQTYADKWRQLDIREQRPYATSKTKQDKSGVDPNSNSLSDQNPEQTEHNLKEKFWKTQRKDILDERRERPKEPTNKTLKSPWW